MGFKLASFRIRYLRWVSKISYIVICILSYRVVSYHIVSYRIVSYHILFYFIVFYRIEWLYLVEPPRVTAIWSIKPHALLQTFECTLSRIVTYIDGINTDDIQVRRHTGIHILYLCHTGIHTDVIQAHIAMAYIQAYIPMTYRHT